jgi:hypothetical protein
MMLTTFLHLMPRLRMSGARPLLPLRAFMVWTATILPFLYLWWHCWMAVVTLHYPISVYARFFKVEMFLSVCTIIYSYNPQCSDVFGLIACHNVIRSSLHFTMS